MHSIQTSLFCVLITLTAFNAEKSNSVDTSEKSSKSAPDSANCDPTSQDVPGHGTIIWNFKLKDVDYYLSTPICLNAQFNFVTRKCIGTTFEDEPECASIQKPVSKCPSDSTEIEVNGRTVCYSVTEPKKYSEIHCKYKNAASMSQFVDFMALFKITEVWYPGSMFGPYGIFLHDEITENYRSIVKDVAMSSKDKNCIKINSLGKKTAVSCEDEYAGLCIFKSLSDLQEYSYCRLKNNDKSFINHYDLNEAKCLFKVTSSSCNSQANTEPAEYLEPFQNYAITYDHNERYRTGLQYKWSTPNGFRWETTNSPLEYAWWSTDVQPGVTDLYSIAQGWTAMNSYKEGFPVDICQAKQKISIQHAHVELSVSTNEISVILKSDHLQFARIGSEPIFCFTDRDKYAPVSKVDLGHPTIRGTEMVYKFTFPENGYAGKYWCESFRLPDFSQPGDSKGLHKIPIGNSDNYVILVTVKFNDGEDPFQPEVVPKRTVELFEAALAGFTFFSVSVKCADVDSIDQAASTVTYILHIWPTASGQGQSDERLERLQEYIENNIDVVRTSDVFSSYYCRTYQKSSTNLYHWEKKQPGEIARKDCNVGFISRGCIKDDDNDFVRGVRWATLDEVCPEHCSDQKQTVNGIEYNWDTPILTTDEGVLYISTPICLDENHGYVTRLKVSGCFIEPAECHSSQPENFKNDLLCPPNLYIYDAIGPLFCYTFTAEVTPYPPKCPYPNNLSPVDISDNVLKTLLTEKNVIWYPAKRYEKYGYTNFLYDEYSNVYRRPVDMGYKINYGDGKIANKDCLIIETSSGELSLKAVPCEQQYTYLCIYKLLQEEVKSYCQLTYEEDKCYHNEFDLAKSNCICPKRVSETCTLAEFLQQYQIYKVSNTEDAYKIGLAFNTNENKYSWAESSTDLTYSRWSKELSLEADVYMSHIGWVQKGFNMNWNLCQFEPSFNTPSLTLDLDSEANKFIVVLTNPNDIIRSRGDIFCFTDTGSYEIVTEITDLAQIESSSENVLYKFNQPHLAGYFWCEVFSYPHFENIESGYLVDFYNHYVFKLTSKFEEAEDPTSPVFVKTNIIEKLQEIFAGTALDFVTVTWSRTEGINDVEKEATYCLNLKTDKLVVYNEEELKQIEEVLEQKMPDVLGDRDVKLTDLLRSSHYCRNLPSNEFYQYDWPLTKIGLTATIECSTEGMVVTRKCEGDFITGGKWGNGEGSCPIEEYDCEPVPGMINPDIYWDIKISNSEENPNTNYYISTPICLDEFYNPLVRTCKDQIFQDEPVCIKIQPAELSYCPEGLEEHEIGDLRFCVSITSEDEYPPKCPYKNTIPFSMETSEVLNTLELTHPVWYPAARNDMFGISYFMNTELSTQYMTYVDAHYENGYQKEKECAILNIALGRIEAVGCTESYKGLCVYSSLDINLNSYCRLKYGEKCFNSHFDLEKMQCYCWQNNLDSCTIAELHLPFQNFIIPIEEDITYKIDVCPQPWNSENQCEYSFWSKNLMFEGDNSYLGIEGWQQSEKEENVRFICEREVLFKDVPAITLTKSATELKFHVQVTNPSDIVVQRDSSSVICFTDAVYDDLLAKIVPDFIEQTEEELKYEFKPPTGESPGHFWCHAFTYPRLEIISTELLLMETYNNYPFDVEFKNYGAGGNPLTKEFVSKFVLKVIQNAFEVAGIDNIEVRWMKTIYVNVPERIAKYVLHITTRNVDDNEDELKILNGILELMSKSSINKEKEGIEVFSEEYKLSISKLRSSSYCQTLTTDEENDYQWDRTPIGEEAIFECLHEDVELKRKCNGDFITGGIWGEIQGTCPKPEDFKCDPVPGQINREVIWNTKIKKQTNDIRTNYYISTPICLDEFYNPLVRTCKDQIFQDEPVCIKIQPAELSYCPEGLKEHKVGDLRFCVSITGEDEYPPKCPYKNTIPFSMETSEVLNTLELTHPVWYPAARNDMFGISYFMNTELSTQYMTYVDAHYENGFQKEKECVILNIALGRIEAVGCTESYKGLCVYSSLDINLNSYCRLKYGEKCFNSHFDLKKMQCYCWKNSLDSCTIAELHLPFQNFIIPIEEDITYKIDVCPQPWNSENQCEYSFWSKNLMFEGDNSYLGIEGWQQSEKEDNVRFICEREVLFKDVPAITLIKSATELKFYVQVTNPSDIVMQRDSSSVICFTDAVYDDLLAKIVPDFIEQTEEELKYEFEPPTGESPGHFWCHAFTYPRLEIISTELLLMETYNNYPFDVEFKNYGDGGNPLTKEFVSNFVLKVIQNAFEVAGIDNIEVRWMKTVYVNVPERTAKYLLHLTTRNVDDNEDELKTLNGILELMSKSSMNKEKEGVEVFSEEHKLSISKLRSSSYCQTLTTDEENDYQWDRTPIGEEAIFECLHEEVVLKRKCYGEFMTGGIWGEIQGTCPKPEDFECDPVPGQINREVIWNTKIKKKSNEIRTNYYVSTPICLDEFLRPQTRICKEAKFQAEPFCNHVQKEINRCPDDLIEKKIGEIYFCYQVTDKKLHYPPNCPYKNTAAFTDDTTKSLMLEILKEPVWYPAKRYPQFEVGYLMLDEPSVDYLSDVQASYIDGQLSDKDCAIRDFDGTIKAVKCNSQYKAFCAYVALENNQFSSCSLQYPSETCYDTNFNLEHQRICHCKETLQSEDCDLAEMHFDYQNFIIQSKSDVVYEIGLCERTWCSRKPLQYSFWSTNLLLEGQNRYLSSDGWQMLPDNKENIHYLCEKRISYGSSSISFVETGSKFKVVLYEIQGIVHRRNFDMACFTDAVHYDLVFKIDLERHRTYHQVVEYIFTNPFPQISGNYWCEAFTYPNLQLITTGNVFYDSGYNNYVVQISTCYEKLDEPLSKHFVEGNVIKPLQTKLEAISILDVTVRWMKTLQIKDSKREVTYLMHLSTLTIKNNEEELASLQDLVQIAVADIPNLKTKSEVVSSSYCPSDGDLWHLAKCGQTVVASTTCMEANGRLVSRTCHGDFMNGCRWKEPTGSCSFTNKDKITNELYELLIGNLPGFEIAKQLIRLTERYIEFHMIDVFLTAVIFEQILPEHITTAQTAKIIHNVMNIHPIVLRDSQLSLNSTDKILYHFDHILLHKKPNPRNSEDLLREGDVNILLFDAVDSQVNGLSIVVKNHKLIYEYLYKNLTDLNAINEKDLILATHIPKGLIEQIISETGGSFTIRMVVFLKDSMFNEEVVEKRFNGGKNIAILLPKTDVTFKIGIPIILKPLYELEQDQGHCGFWNYGYNNNQEPIQGSWSKTSQMQILQDNIRCEFDHTTHFAFLIMGSQSDFEKTILENSYVLLIITTIECVLSILGIVGIFITAILFKTWRRNKGNQILLHLSFVTFFQFGLLYISGAIKENSLIDDDWCFAIGIALHYSVLAQFCWMLVIAYLQYKRFVQVFKRSQSSIVLKSCVVGYLLPALPVLYLVFAHRDSYLDEDAGICYPSGDGLTYGVLLPIGCIILINILLFACIIFNIFFPKSKANKFDDDLLMLRFRLVFVLFFMLGMTWIFGILGQMTRNIMFLFLFSLTASLQGFILFMFFIVFNKRSRKLYIHYFKIKKYGA